MASRQGSLFIPDPPPKFEGIGAIERWASAHQLFPTIGVDEAGRGPLAGPVVAAAVCFPPVPLPPSLKSLDDSKRLSEKKRMALLEPIKAHALAYAISEVSPEQIDKVNILQATFEAMRIAVTQACEILRVAGYSSPHLLIDGSHQIPACSWSQHALVSGDQRSLQIAAASILAKVSRDQKMVTLEEEHPGYGFGSHKGYGTRAHLEALDRLGPCQEHRRSFRPVREAAARWEKEARDDREERSKRS
ncbi:MAG: ribonuclease HII [Myxococcota bacterium]|nr:ribonuclease HII [Myxococcota bacterium]